MSKDANAPGYLTVVGSLSSEEKLTLHPGYITQFEDLEFQTNTVNDPGQLLGVEMMDDEQSVVGRYYLPLVDICPDRAIATSQETAPNERMVAGKVPFDPKTRVLRFYHYNKIVHEVEVSKSAPEVELDWKPSKTVEGSQTVRWTGKHPEGKPLYYMVCYSHTAGKTWQPMSLSIEDTKLEIDFDQLPGGSGRVGIIATDGVNTVMVESETFGIAKKGYIAMIFAPPDGATVDSAARFQGQGYHIEQQRAETQKLTWSSSIDGTLGKGTILDVPKLSSGTHEITLKTGTGKSAGTSSIKIEVK